MMMKNILNTFVMVSTVLLMAACSNYSKPFERRVNLSFYSYKAADELISQSSDMVDYDTPIVVATLSNVNKLDTSSPLGRSFSDQMMTRFVEEGFENVSEIRLRRSLYLRESSKAASGEFLLSRDARAIAEARDAGAAVVGTYAVGGNEVLISARLIEVATGKVLSASDVRIPMNSHIEELLDDDADFRNDGRIFSSTSPSMTFAN